jgi:mRNA-degrading endonuclease toxin of MazEF toxin-antitoxin module
VVARGEVWWVDFGAPLGSEPGMRRPAVVVSDDRFNRSRLSTVTVVAITFNLKLAQRPGNIALAGGAAGLDRPSWLTLPRSRRSTATVLSLGLAPSPLQLYAGSTTACASRYTCRPRL